jgi:hypothetical protein
MNWGNEELGDERRVVQTARDADSEVLGRKAFDHDWNALRERDGDG